MSKFNLRRKPRISYCEYEEPNLDEYVYCDKCTDFVYEYCSIHGPPLVIPDDEVKPMTGVPSFVPRAALTIPHEFLHLASSIIPGAGLGVFSTLTLPRDVRFGPYRGHLTKNVDSMYCWQLHDGNNKWSHAIDAADGNSSNWMRYVNCARHYREQNLVAYQYQGEIYYRTIKIIPRFTELMVFYGSEFAQLLGINLRLYNDPSGFDQLMAATFSSRRHGEIPVNEVKNETTVVKEMRKLNKVQNKKKQLKIDRSQQRNKNNQLTEKKKKVCRTFVQNDVTRPESCQSKNIDNHSKNENASKNYSDLNNNSKNEKQQESIEHFICDVCNEKFSLKNTLEDHIKNHQGAFNSNNNFKLNNVNVNPTNVLKLNCNYSKQITEQDKVECDNCNVKYKVKTSLVTKRNDKMHKLHICNKTFTEKCSVKHNILINKGTKNYKCDICDKAFTQSCNLNKHLLIHSGIKPHKCDICDKAFTHSISLKQHLLQHSGIKPHKCDICDKAFTQSSVLKRHILIHSGIKPHKCDICDKAFTHSMSLKQHLLQHSGIKPHKCDICDKAFTHSCNLNKHLLIHSGIRPHKCDICDKAFTQSNALKLHLLIHSGIKPHKCDICDKAFTQSSNLKRHLLIHSGIKP